MKNLLLSLLCISVLFYSACKPSREKSVAQIQGLEKRLFSPETVSFDKVKADSLMNLYAAFIKSHPKDTLTPVYLFKSASLAMNSGDGGKALLLFDQYLNDYPDLKKAPLCMFFKAFIYENMLRNLEKAKETYLLFIERYPNHEFVRDARMAIRNLGKTPEQIVSEFEAQRKADSIRKADSLALAKKIKPKKK